MKNILITGARSGIASKVIELLKQENYHIYVAVHTIEQLKQVTKKYQEELHITCLKLDITNREDWKQLDTISIDIFLANAAIGVGGTLCNIDMNRVRENYEVNIFSNLELIQYVLKKMIERKQGKIIVMTSLAGILPVPFLGSYCSTKAALIKWMECLRLELIELKLPIQLSIIEPGLYRTGFNQVMFENKYPELETDDFFNSILDFLYKQDELLIKLACKNTTSIALQIKKAILKEHPRFIYRAPLIQVVGAKVYQLFFE